MARSRSPAKELIRLLGTTSFPLAVLNAARQVVYCNNACADWLQVDAQALVGRSCHYGAGDPGDPLDIATAAICPPPETLAGRRIRVSRSGPHGDAAPSTRQMDFVPLPSGEGALAGVLVVARPPDADDMADQQTPDEAESRELHDQLFSLRRAMGHAYRLAHLVGATAAIRRVREQVRLAKETSARVVVVGPGGSGREHVARTIHYGDDAQRTGPLVPLSCSLLNAELLQTTITAFARRCDEMKPIRAGALLLLDVDALPSDAQRELAGFLTLPTFRLHTIATAREDLIARARRGEFDVELASLLSTLVIELPAVADRREDIPLLAQHFLEEWNAKGGRQLSGLTSDSLDELAEYPWPRNLDELREFVHAACEKASGTRITVADLPKRIRLAADAAAVKRASGEPIVLDELLTGVEAELIRRALRQAQGNKAKAARLLGISRPRLLRRVEQLGIE